MFSFDDLMPQNFCSCYWQLAQLADWEKKAFCSSGVKFPCKCGTKGPNGWQLWKGKIYCSTCILAKKMFLIVVIAEKRPACSLIEFEQFRYPHLYWNGFPAFPLLKPGRWTRQKCEIHAVITALSPLNSQAFVKTSLVKIKRKGTVSIITIWTEICQSGLIGQKPTLCWSRFGLPWRNSGTMATKYTRSPAHPAMLHTAQLLLHLHNWKQVKNVHKSKGWLFTFFLSFIFFLANWQPLYKGVRN